MKKFLIVDDHQDMTEVYEHSAQIAGVNVTVKRNAYEALEFLGQNNYQVDAAILDLNMPYIDGLDLSDQIRLNETPYRGDDKLPLFFYTGYSENDAIKKVRERNKVSGLFIKAQYAPLDVLTEIKAWLGGERKQAGSANPAWLITLIAVIAQILTVSLGLWLLNKQDVAAAYRWADMKSQRDQYKKSCDTNYLLNMQKDKFIENSKLTSPPEIFGAAQCVVSESKEK